jgi:hypothetical protein
VVVGVSVAAGGRVTALGEVVAVPVPERMLKPR